MTSEELSLVKAFQATQASRLVARGKWCRAKALEPGQFPEKWLTRAEEAEECARIVADLSPSYVAPAEPDMRAARASSKGPG